MVSRRLPSASFQFTNSSTLQVARRFLASSRFFDGGRNAPRMRFHPRWVHAEPLALAMAAAWAASWKRRGQTVRMPTSGPFVRFAARMRLYEHAGLPSPVRQVEHEEAGRFLPVTRVRQRGDERKVLADISALLHLDHDPEDLRAAQYCVSELVRNAIEHAAADDGAFVCAQRYPKGRFARVSIAVADCTRCLARGTGGYFLLLSGNACYRLRRREDLTPTPGLVPDPLEDCHDLWALPSSWQGTVAAVEIRTDRIENFADFFGWIRERMPRSEEAKVRFT